MAVLCIALSRLRSRLRAISLATMGELEGRARQRLQRFNEQMELQISEVARFQGEFDKYGLTTQNEKRAAILCRYSALPITLSFARYQSGHDGGTGGACSSASPALHRTDGVADLDRKSVAEGKSVD